jgi:hypothetical protein
LSLSPNTLNDLPLPLSESQPVLLIRMKKPTSPRGGGDAPVATTASIEV